MFFSLLVGSLFSDFPNQNVIIKAVMLEVAIAAVASIELKKIIYRKVRTTAIIAEKIEYLIMYIPCIMVLQEPSANINLATINLAQDKIE